MRDVYKFLAVSTLTVGMAAPVVAVDVEDKREEVLQQQEDVRDEQQDVREEQQDVLEGQRDEQQDVTEARKDVMEEKQARHARISGAISLRRTARRLSLG